MKQFNNLIILAIETSCDDTCVSIVKVKEQRTKAKSFEVLSNVVSSQVKLHEKYGGVYPFLAKREHQKNLPVVYKKALRQAQSKQKFKKPDLIAVTVGPGLEPCLWTGVNFAIKLSKNLHAPIVPVNHIEAHLLVNFLNLGHLIRNTKYLFPAVCLVVSGGHTQLILMERIGKYKAIGQTRDDAAGECFDKTARILGLGYPGGPVIAAEAAKHDMQNTKYNIQLPRPMIYQKNYDFSFSGLKTAVLYDFKKRIPRTKKSKSYIRQMCSEIQQAAIDVLIHKTLKAARNFKAKTIILGGGVAANKELRKQLRRKIEKEMPSSVYHAPDQKHCTDNALMTAVTAYYHRKEKTKEWKKIKANANLEIGQKYERETS